MGTSLALFYFYILLVAKFLSTPPNKEQYFVLWISVGSSFYYEMEIC